MKTDDEVLAIMDKACSGGGEPGKSAGDCFREFAEEVVAMRRRIAELERQVADLIKP